MAYSTNYLDKLNDKQKEAALHTEGPLLILAGAGSGKTSTMTCRIARLILEEGVEPWNILAVTFTNKAAREMRDRVEQLLGGSVNMWLLTFHSACLRILRAHADRLGYDKDFAVYDPTDQKTVARNLIKGKNLDPKMFTPTQLLSVISHCKEQELSPAGFLRIEGDTYRNRTLSELYEAYETTLKKNNAMDFDDLLLNTVRLFDRNEDVLLQYQRRFRYIMVDEYQDTNHIQYRFVKMLAEESKNICVVGDDDQCIYQWRGADIRNILDFEKDFPGTRVIKLEQNYRSYGNILAAAHSVIRHNRGRKDKELWTSKDAGEKIKYFRVGNEKEEARFVAREIERLHEGASETAETAGDQQKAESAAAAGLAGGSLTAGALTAEKKYRYKDFAVLYRTNAQSRNFEEAFSAAGISYRVMGGVRYYDRKEIKDIVAYMRLVQNPADDLALTRIINEPKRGIGEKTLEKLQTLANVRGESLFSVLCDPEIRAGLPGKAVASVGEMVEAISEYHEERANLRVSDIYDALLVRTGYMKALELQNTIEAEGRLENLMEFKSVIYDYEKEDPQISLEEFMEKIALMSDIDNHDPNEDAVVLMTMHSAKGLEFPVVFMPGMEEGLFPSRRSADRMEGLEEERRLCYVGMTRAMEKLYLLSSEQRMLYGRTDYARESQFLKEIDKALVEGNSIYEKKSGTSRGQYSDGYSEKLPYKPFDPLKYAKQETARRGSTGGGGNGAALALAEGDRVRHAKFGEGLVIAVSGRTATVAFDSAGVKKLAADIAPMEKI